MLGRQGAAIIKERYSVDVCLPQMVALAACFVVLGTLNSALYATLAAQVRRFIQSYRARKNINRATGGILIAMGGMMGLAKRAA